MGSKNVANTGVANDSGTRGRLPETAENSNKHIHILSGVNGFPDFRIFDFFKNFVWNISRFWTSVLQWTRYREYCWGVFRCFQYPRNERHFTTEPRKHNDY